MLGYMVDQQLLAVGSVTAVMTVELFVLRVAEEMRLEVTRLRERVPADDTLEGLLLSVSPHMIDKRTAHCEPLSTNCAWVRLMT